MNVFDPYFLEVIIIFDMLMWLDHLISEIVCGCFNFSLSFILRKLRGLV